MYDANSLNQYTAIAENGGAPFIPQFDADGNQTLNKTETGIWSAVYNAENRPVSFTNTESNTVVECQYDSMGRRAYKKVTVDSNVTLHQRYIYRGYLQIACSDLTRSHHPALWYITWDPLQPVATRPLAIQINGTWYTYGWDLTKNICELYSTAGAISTSYTYTPFGQVTATGSVTQIIQWSSEVWDAEVGIISYAHRYLNSMLSSWTSRDNIFKGHLYKYINNNSSYSFDYLGLLEVYHFTDIDAVKKILEEGYKGEFLWTGERGAPAGGGNSWQAQHSHTIKLDIPDELVNNAEQIPYKKHHAYYEEGLRKLGVHEQADAYRWDCVEKDMRTSPKNVFVIQRSANRGQRGKGKWVVVKVNSINKSGIRILEVPGINANTASIPPLLYEASRKFNITKYVNIKTGLVGLSYAIGAYELYTVRNSPKEITKIVYGWAGSYIGMKYGAAAAAGTIAIAGQLGPQIATPEEVLTVPIAAILGGVVGGVAGGLVGSAVTEIVDNFTFTRGYEL